MKRILILIAVVFCVMPVDLFAERVVVDFIYAAEADSFNFYMDDSVYCTIEKTGLTTTTEGYSMECDSAAIPVGWHSFSMTAILNGEETLHSPEFRWFNRGIDTPPPTMTEVTITINGESVILK